MELSVWGRYRLSDTLSWKPPDYSDAGNAKILVDEYNGLLAFCDALGWLSWTGTHWEQNDHKAVEKAIELTEHMIMESGVELDIALHSEADAKIALAQDKEGAKEQLARAKETVKQAKAYFAHASKSRNVSHINGMLKLSQPPLHIAADKLDADPFLLNTPGGMVNLQTGEIRPHSIDAPFQYCTRITNVSPGSQGAAVWSEFLQTITCGDDSLASFLQQVAGMAAIGHVYHEGIVIANGSGRNGKSTFFNALYGVLGAYAGTIDSNTLTTDRQNRGASLATLRGKRLVIAAELEEHQRLSSSILKKLASTDKLTIEEKYRAPEDITQSHTLILFTNFLPRVGSMDNGTWRRLTVIPFHAVIPEDTAVQNLSDYLIEEAGPAILSWIIEGAVNFTLNGFKLTIPDAVAMATEEYRSRENWLERFIDERCIREPNARVGARELYTEYKSWATEAGEYIHRENDFSDAMEKAGYQKVTPKNKRTWLGLRLDLAGIYGNPCAARV